MDQRIKVSRMLIKMSIMIEGIDWSAKELRSNEISICNDNLRKAIKNFKDVPYIEQARKEDGSRAFCPSKIIIE